MCMGGAIAQSAVAAARYDIHRLICAQATSSAFAAASNSTKLPMHQATKLHTITIHVDAHFGRGEGSKPSL